MTSQNKQQLWPYTFPILASANRTETTSSAYFENTGNFRGVRIYIECTVDDEAASVTFSIQARDPINSEFHTLLTSAAVAAVGRSFLEVYPAGAATNNIRATNHIGRGFRVTATHADGDDITYNVVGEWLT